MNHGHRLLMQLNLVPEAGPRAANHILSFLAQQAGLPADFFTSPEFSSHLTNNIDFNFIRELSPIDLVEQVGLTPQSARASSQALLNNHVFDAELALMDRHNITCVTLIDDAYPELLRTINLPPPVIYVQGEPLARNAKRLAVVGARAADDYAHATLAAILPDIIANGWHIVSGGALGADAYAHELTLQMGGKTTAVLGSGLLNRYPSPNFDLFDRIAQYGGSLISIFPLQTNPDKMNFPIRNRVIAGLSQGCAVVQAARRSGALITAQYALEQGRQIFAIPGSLFSVLSEGCHDLIGQGATIISSAASILESLDNVVAEKQQSLVFTVPTPSSTTRIGYIATKAHDQVSHPILACFEGPMTIDDLVTKADRSHKDLQDLLFTLQLEGFVKQNFAGLWERL